MDDKRTKERAKQRTDWVERMKLMNWRNSCETALLSLTENWKKALDDRKIVGVLSTDMSKAFDSLYHPLILSAYGVSDNSVKLLDSYFTDRYSRAKLGPVVSEWEKVSRGCPQGSAFGSLLWNIYQNDRTYVIDVNLNMYADDHQSVLCHEQRNRDCLCQFNTKC